MWEEWDKVLLDRIYECLLMISESTPFRSESELLKERAFGKMQYAEKGSIIFGITNNQIQVSNVVLHDANFEDGIRGSERGILGSVDGSSHRGTIGLRLCHLIELVCDKVKLIFQGENVKMRAPTRRHHSGLFHIRSNVDNNLCNIVLKVTKLATFRAHILYRLTTASKVSSKVGKGHNSQTARHEFSAIAVLHKTSRHEIEPQCGIERKMPPVVVAILGFSIMA
ncbi:hypothetical protein DL96DRAFT_1676604 [Flagelloscypha sp. PMI_526]|nr:hypothetical protein DL96DRAFT_1676604 [Flagelloscypha sp. PMI_526]